MANADAETGSVRMYFPPPFLLLLGLTAHFALASDTGPPHSDDGDLLPLVPATHSQGDGRLGVHPESVDRKPLARQWRATILITLEGGGTIPPPPPTSPLIYHCRLRRPPAWGGVVDRQRYLGPVTALCLKNRGLDP